MEKEQAQAAKEKEKRAVEWVELRALKIGAPVGQGALKKVRV